MPTSGTVTRAEAERGRRWAQTEFEVSVDLRRLELSALKLLARPGPGSGPVDLRSACCGPSGRCNGQGLAARGVRQSVPLAARPAWFARASHVRVTDQEGAARVRESTKEELMGTRRPCKADIRRRREQLQVEPPLPDLDPAIESYNDNSTPRAIEGAVWEAIRPFVAESLHRYGPEHLEAGRQRLTALAAYAAWAHWRGLEVTRDRLLDVDLIETFTTTADLGKTAAANSRSRLRGITRKLNQAGAGTPEVARHAHRAVKGPYTAAEVATIIRITNTQPSASVGRQLKICVGPGAGLSSADLKPLRGRDVTDRGEQGITVRIAQGADRTVGVRRRFQPIFRAGIDGARAGNLLLGKSAARRNSRRQSFRTRPHPRKRLALRAVPDADDLARDAARRRGPAPGHHGRRRA